MTVNGETDTSIRGKAIFWIGLVVSIWHIYVNTFGTLPELYVSGLHFGMFALLGALTLLPGRLWVAACVGVVGLASGAFVIVGEQPLYDRGLEFTALDWAFALTAIAIALELVRRSAGLFIPAIIVLALSYVVWWGRHVPGVLQFPGLSLETVAFRSYYGSDGMFGPIARISSTFVFMFILFGAFLVRSGAGDFVIGMARAFADRVRGGPGFVAVIASALTGTVTGSAVANTVSTGVVTIPLMRRAGFPARFAAGVEAASSTGGQLMPPIMGAGAFVMASYTQIPYLDIVAVSVLPALLYFLSIGFFVRIEASKRALETLGEDAEPVSKILRTRGPPFLIPIGVLIGLLIAGFTPTYAAGIAILAVVASSWLTPARMGPRAVMEALALGARNMTSTAVLLIAIGLVVNVIATTGIGTTFSLMINAWAGGNLLVAIVLVALASLVLGMGLPVTASYIVLATLSAPALYHMIAGAQLLDVLQDGTLAEGAKAIVVAAQPHLAEALAGPLTSDAALAVLGQIPGHLIPLIVERGLDPAVLTAALLSAHMIIFWLSQDSNVTPPVCIVAFSAAAIAGTRPMATGFTAWKIAKGLYIVPVLFAYTPLLSGDYVAALQVFAFAAFGLYALAGAFEGHLEKPTGALMRLILLGAGVGLLWPQAIAINVVALVGFIVIFVANLRRA